MRYYRINRNNLFIPSPERLRDMYHMNTIIQVMDDERIHDVSAMILLPENIGKELYELQENINQEKREIIEQQENKIEKINNSKKPVYLKYNKGGRKWR